MIVMTGYAGQVLARDIFRRGKNIRKVAEMVSPEALRFFVEYTLRQLKGFVPKDSLVEYTVIFNGQDKMAFTVPQIYEEKDKLEPDIQIQGTVY